MRDPGTSVVSPGHLCALLGPTAVGKTALSIELARELDAEILSVDSKQIYRYLDIGTAKPSTEQRAAVPHHLIDCVDPDEPFSVADFQRLADRAIAEITARNKRVLLVGGAGLYFRALVDGLFQMPAVKPEIRERLRQQVAEVGSSNLHARLSEVDPTSADQIHPNDALRIMRALEVYEQTGTPISQLQQQWCSSLPRYRFTAVVVNRPRAELYSRIDERVDQMLAQGWVDEVRDLRERGYGAGLVSMDSFGYRELLQYLDGTLSWSKAVEQIKRSTRRFAKRQLTWFRGDPRPTWIDLTSHSEVSAIEQSMQIFSEIGQ